MKQSESVELQTCLSIIILYLCIKTCDVKEKQGISNNFNSQCFWKPAYPLPLEAERKRGGERKRSREKEETGDRRTENKYGERERRGRERGP